MILLSLSLPGRGETDRCIARIAGMLASGGYRLAGCVGLPARAAAHPCDMDLLLLPEGPRIPIHQHLGSASEGCRLDASAVEAAVVATAGALATADVLVVNKWGKLESMGRGFAPLVADALGQGKAVIVGVNAPNLDSFLGFSEGCDQPLGPTPALALDRMATVFSLPRASMDTLAASQDPVTACA